MSGSSPHSVLTLVQVSQTFQSTIPLLLDSLGLEEEPDTSTVTLVIEAMPALTRHPIQAWQSNGSFVAQCSHPTNRSEVVQGRAEKVQQAKSVARWHLLNLLFSQIVAKPASNIHPSIRALLSDKPSLLHRKRSHLDILAQPDLDKSGNRVGKASNAIGVSAISKAPGSTTLAAAAPERVQPQQQEYLIRLKWNPLLDIGPSAQLIPKPNEAPSHASSHRQTLAGPTATSEPVQAPTSQTRATSGSNGFKAPADDPSSRPYDGPPVMIRLNRNILLDRDPKYPHLPSLAALAASASSTNVAKLQETPHLASSGLVRRAPTLAAPFAPTLHNPPAINFSTRAPPITVPGDQDVHRLPVIPPASFSSAVAPQTSARAPLALPAPFIVMHTHISTTDHFVIVKKSKRKRDIFCEDFDEDNDDDEPNEEPLRKRRRVERGFDLHESASQGERVVSRGTVES